ncbi:tubulin-tyrosine ligase activity [Nesidiocoris tenuis]|uniref:Tubulin-tyrosine ligase activity n=1 Tax=Nesidiocoris tenuis TaxID=355587 RepID=A0ABN7A765_9HEMI|nr:tubulin-tyrosine ligase activity [Nesidiocoris tenuis]
MKHEFLDGADIVRMHLDAINVNAPSLVNYSPAKRQSGSPVRLRSYSQSNNNQTDLNSNGHLRSDPYIDHPYSVEKSVVRTSGDPSNAWSTGNGVQEKYLREVEALRGKLRELRGTTPRKLPTPPTHAKLKPLVKVLPSLNRPDVQKDSYPLAPLSSSPNRAVVHLYNSSRANEIKRTQLPSHSECVTVPIVGASAKRLREQSPSNLQSYRQLPDTVESLPSSPERAGTSSLRYRTLRNSSFGKMGTTCVERENGEHYTVRIDRNSDVSYSVIATSSDMRSPKLRPRSPIHPSSLADPLEVLPSPNNLPKEIALNHVHEVKKVRCASFSAGTSPVKEVRISDPEPLSLPTPDLSSVAAEEKIPIVTEPSSSFSVDSESPSADSLQSPADKNYLRLSLFSNVPPFVRFTGHNEKAEHELPKAIQKALKWKLSTITPLVVKHTVTNSGFRLVKRTGEWGGIWGRHMKSVCFKTLYDYQKINHLPGTFQIGRKDRLWKNIYKFMTKFGKKEFGFLPRTYVLPQDTKILRQAWDKNSKGKWIVKPPAAARGTGIKVINKWTQIPKKTPVIVQKYISNPYLINGNKFDLRLYVLVTNFHPLKIYLYTNGLVRFASVKYSDDSSTLSNRYMHLTNFSINKLSNNYAANEDAEACVGHKWTIKSLWSYLNSSVNVDSLWDSMVDLVVKTMISGEAPIVNLSHANLNSRYSAYELFGVDVLLDENLKPWLLEVNISPSLHSTSPLDIAVKGPMVKDLLNIVGYHVPDRFNDISKDELCKKLGIKGPLCYDSRMYVPELSPKEQNKQAFFSEIADRESYLDSILDDLTPDDVRHLIAYEDEITQIGNFQKVFPTPHTHEYFQFFEESRYYNMLLDAWETRYSHCREEGVQLLETKCVEQIHLDISEVEPRQFTYFPSDPSLKGEEVDGDGDTTSIDSGGNRGLVKRQPLKCLRIVRPNGCRMKNRFLPLRIRRKSYNEFPC